MSGIWLLNRLNADHKLFNPGKIYTETANIEAGMILTKNMKVSIMILKL